MLKQAENKVKIEGILSEIDLKPGSFVKDGKTIESIGGTIKVKVDQVINGEDTSLEIPVHMFASKTTNKGTPNPAYDSISKVMNEYVSIAAAPAGVPADKIRITSGSINMNEYHNANGDLVSFPRINTSFISKVKSANEFKPEATFSVQFVVANMADEVDREGNPTGRYKVRGIIPQYGGKVDVVDFIAANPNVISAVSSYWNNGDTVQANGRLNFSSKTETIVTEVDFGEPVSSTRTINVSELVITGGSQNPLEGDFAYDMADITAALEVRKANLEKQKEKDMSRAKQKQAPTQTSVASNNALSDLGF